MCGRSACTLNSDTLCRTCGYKNAAGKELALRWVESEVKYVPSPNMGPKDIVPCIVGGSHFSEFEEERVLCPMLWSMIPFWHTDDYRKCTLATHNARLENIKTSKLYSAPLKRKQRCIVVCEGYYEWKAGTTKKDKKQPYYIYATQDKGVKMDDPFTWNNEWSEESGWKGIKVLKMAGIFDRFKTQDGKIIYSCSIITRNSNDVLSWLHERVPVFLRTERDAQTWLSARLSMDEAIERLEQMMLVDGDLSWHMVSSLVNNVMHKSEECRKEIKPIEEKKNNSASFMASWLKRGSAESAKRKSNESEKDDETPSKIAKKK